MIDKSVRNGARGVERDLREIGHFVDAQPDFGLLHGEHCFAQVGVAHQSGVDEGAQLRIGEDWRQGVLPNEAVSVTVSAPPTAVVSR